MAKAAVCRTGGKMFVNEHTTFTEINNGVPNVKHFPGNGVIDDQGQFRKLTEDEEKDVAIHSALHEEAKTAGSCVSLNNHPLLGRRILFFGDRGSIPLNEKYDPGSVSQVSADELKQTPFVSTGTINGSMKVDMKMVTALSIGSSGS